VADAYERPAQPAALSHMSQQLYGLQCERWSRPNVSRRNTRRAHCATRSRKRVGRHSHLASTAQDTLFQLAQSLSPESRLLQLFYVTEGQGTVYEAIAQSGDDTVSGQPKLSVGSSQADRPSAQWHSPAIQRRRTLCNEQNFCSRNAKTPILLVSPSGSRCSALLLAESGAPSLGKMVVGTTSGNLHDIGKNLVGMMKDCLIKPGGRLYSRTAGSPDFIIDIDTDEWRPAVVEDVKNIYTLMDALDGISICTAAFAQDWPKFGRDILMLREMMSHTDKHIHMRTDTVETFPHMLEMAAIVAGGKEELKKRPKVVVSLNCRDEQHQMQWH
jgi:hypothetical protein